MNVLTAILEYGSITDFINREIAEMTGLAAHRVQVIITRLVRGGSILSHTKTFMTDEGIRRHRTILVKSTPGSAGLLTWLPYSFGPTGPRGGTRPFGG